MSEAWRKKERSKFREKFFFYCFPFLLPFPLSHVVAPPVRDQFFVASSSIPASIVAPTAVHYRRPPVLPSFQHNLASHTYRYLSAATSVAVLPAQPGFRYYRYLQRPSCFVVLPVPSSLSRFVVFQFNPGASPRFRILPIVIPWRSFFVYYPVSFPAKPGTLTLTLTPSFHPSILPPRIIARLLRPRQGLHFGDSRLSPSRLPPSFWSGLSTPLFEHSGPLLLFIQSHSQSYLLPFKLRLVPRPPSCPNNRPPDVFADLPSPPLSSSLLSPRVYHRRHSFLPSSSSAAVRTRRSLPPLIVAAPLDPVPAGSLGARSWEGTYCHE
jgi:hypothetical protein